ncbi:MAG: 4-(cytidine 5'-diphospho)-2-C-methyl-D-erythritol kinase [Roseburia sp.]|nr:4-(cytidine 5'-diphospho)-2-C-methyl-D-erythritol kinase [Roseburia sp.]MCM1279504.1 4-(cytidine 5'-diphospho)-2-C-methyl-D-erythritol kinase [Robinsoniella sp.]
MEEIKRRAYGKINLGLDVLRKRPDGYHDVRMIMQMVSVYDELTFQKIPDKEIRIAANKEELPLNEDNLIYKAAKLILERLNREEGISVTLEKHIPIAAGMAGGSTDAAATLLGINELFGGNIPIEELLSMGVKIGADVPYCILQKTALSEGIGEVLTPLPAPPACSLLIGKPDINVSTKYVYENLQADALKSHPDIDGMRKAIEEQDLEGVTSRMENVLETVTIQKYPVIGEIKEAMLKAGAANALMSGSGPTVFGIFASKEQAEKAKKELAESGLVKELFVAEFVNP